jgi:hypothetical protein
MQNDPTSMADHVELYGLTCVPCHDGRDRMSGFDHAQVYPLEGGHAPLECADCHADYVYLTQSRSCLDCHADPEIHVGQFGLDCTRCHTDRAWAPATLTRHVFDLNHGGGAHPACETCHVETLAVYTCYGCHDHEPEPMRTVHLEEGIVELEPCAACHPTGAPGEAQRIMELKRPVETGGSPFAPIFPTPLPQEFPLGLAP